MSKEFQQIEWDERTADDCRHIIRRAIREDLEESYDLTTRALVAPESRGKANVVVREPGVVAGLPAAQLVVQEMNLNATFEVREQDGSRVAGPTCIAEFSGSTGDLLTAERLMLNLLGRLSGIASLARRYVDRVAETRAAIYDTRKTTPGWRRLEKYAVRCGGGRNHRTGLFDAVLIKDNHLAQGDRSPADAVRHARHFLETSVPGREHAMVEIEVDTWEQFEQVLDARPDIVLLDNMSPDQMRQAVQLRDDLGVATELEASGGITLERVGEVARCGVERISVGALTHSATTLDIGLDWVLV
ncbi:MAG: carboxylating nicotinate-nucleotide diphosphorylase [Pirellulaceae bacterium]